MQFIKYMGGVFTAVYNLDEGKKFLEHRGVQVTKETPDDVLVAIGLRRLEPDNDPDTAEKIKLYGTASGPHYRFKADGTATAIEYYVPCETTFEQVRRNKVTDIYAAKDAVMGRGLQYKGYTIDLRFRNIAYISLIAVLVNNNAVPEEFTWYSTRGEIIPLTKTECLELVNKTLELVKEVELCAIKELEKLEKLYKGKDKAELAKFSPRIKVGL